MIIFLSISTFSFSYRLTQTFAFTFQRPSRFYAWLIFVWSKTFLRKRKLCLIIFFGPLPHSAFHFNLYSVHSPLRALDSLKTDGRTSPNWQRISLSEVIKCLEDLIDYFAQPGEDEGLFGSVDLFIIFQSSSTKKFYVDLPVFAPSRGNPVDELGSREI